MEDILKYTWKKGVKEVFPVNNLVKNWLFQDGQEDEACLAEFIARIAEKNGLSANDVMHIYPLILRMLKSTNEWAK